MRFYGLSSPGRVGKGGFTLVEMLIALTLIAVATAIGTSALRAYYETRRSRGGPRA
jgi:prepilin-type N-terminal cleavage/methylation domain-containing protein